jgi:hypothetical protein
MPIIGQEIFLNLFVVIICKWLYMHSANICHFRFLSLHIKPVTDEQVFYDKFLCDKFYLLVCMYAQL